MLFPIVKDSVFIVLFLFLWLLGAVGVDAEQESVNTFSLSCRDASLRSVLASLSIQKGINIAGLDSIDSGLTVTIHLESVAVDAGLNALLSPQGFTFEKRDEIYFIQTQSPAQPPRHPPHSTHASGTDINIVIQGELISLKADDASLTEILAELAKRLKINLSVVGEIEREVTVSLFDKPLADLFYSLAKMTGYTYYTEGDLHFFGKASVLPEQMNPLIQSKTIWLKHLQAREVLNLLPADIPKPHVTVSETHNTVTIVGAAELIKRTEQFLKELDIDSDTLRSRSTKGTIAIAVDKQTQRLTVDIKNAPLFDVIRQLSIHTGVDVVFLYADSDVPKETATTDKSSVSPPKVDRVTVRLTEARLEAVLKALFIGSRYAYRWTEAKEGLKPMLIIGQANREPFTAQEFHSLKYLDVVDVMELLPQPKDVVITPLPSPNALLLTGSKQNMDRYKAKIEAIDLPQPMAMIRLYLLELTKGNRDELGLTIEGVDNRATLTVDDGSRFNFDSLKSVPKAFGAKLNALVKENRGKVLANPSLAVVNGHKASIEIGGRHLFETNNPIYPTIGSTLNTGQQRTEGITTFNSYPPSIYRSHFTIETGLMLELTPSIGASKEVSMDIQLSIRDASELSREASSLNQRLITTTISVPDKGMVVIGGLLQEKEKEQVSRLPLLWRLPLIGKYLFTSTETMVEQTELVVIIQPEVIDR